MTDVEAPLLLVVLDTEPIEHAVFQFDSGALLELRNEATRLGLQLAITDIQFQEIQAHVTEQVRQVKKLAKALEAGAGSKSVRKDTDVSKNGGVPLPRLLKHHLVKPALAELDRSADRMMASFEEFFNSKTIRIIDSGNVAASRILPKYFASEPPFGAGRKKDEFPDAFSIEAIRDLAATLSGTQMVVVSGDNDWLEALEGDPSIVLCHTIAEALQHIRKLDDIGTSVAGLLVGKQTRLNEIIEEEFPELGFSLAGDWSGDVDDVEVNGSEIRSIAVTSFRDCKATIEFEVDIHFHAAASYPDDNWTEWYPTFMKADIDKHEILVGTAIIVLDKGLSEIEDVNEVSLDDDAIEVSLDDATRIYHKRSTVQE